VLLHISAVVNRVHKPQCGASAIDVPKLMSAVDISSLMSAVPILLSQLPQLMNSPEFNSTVSSVSSLISNQFKQIGPQVMANQNM
jgi:hypothetical protein